MSMPDTNACAIYDLLSCTILSLYNTNISYSPPPSIYKMNLVCFVGETLYIALGQDIHTLPYYNLHPASNNTSTRIFVKTASVINSMKMYPIKSGTLSTNVMIVTCHDDGSIHVHHNTTLVFTRQLGAPAWGQCLCPIDNLLFVSANDHKIHVVDLHSNDVGIIEGHMHNIPCIDYKDKYLVSGSIDSTVRMWKMVENVQIDDGDDSNELSKKATTWHCMGQLTLPNWVWAVQWIHKHDIWRGRHGGSPNNETRSPADVVVEESTEDAIPNHGSDSNSLDLFFGEHFESDILLIEQTAIVDETYSIDNVQESGLEQLDHVLQWNTHGGLHEAWQMEVEHEGDHDEDTRSQISTDRFHSDMEEQVAETEQPPQITVSPATPTQPENVKDAMLPSQQLILHPYLLAVATDRDFYIYSLPNALPILSCKSILSSIRTNDKHLLLRNYSLDWSFDRFFGMQWIAELSTMVLANQMGFIVLVHLFHENEGSEGPALMKSKEVLLPRANQVTTPLLGFTVNPTNIDYVNKLDRHVNRRSFEVSAWHINGVVNVYELSEHVINEDIL